MSGIVGAWLVLGAVMADAPKQSKAEEIASLIERLGDDDFDRREAAEERLLKIGEPAREALIAAILGHRDREVASRSRRLLRGLGSVPRPALVAKLIGQLGDESFEVREAASKGLVKIGRSALGQLEAARKSPDLEVVRRAERVIATIRILEG